VEYHNNNNFIRLITKSGGRGKQWRSWLRKVAGSIPDVGTGIFH
jgi:hypothetical protein